MKDFSAVTFEIIDININASPDIYINKNGITFTKKLVEVLSYPAYVQYCISAEQKVFAVRACKGNESKAVPFSKPKGEQITQISTTNKNITDAVRLLMPEECTLNNRYRVTGHFDADSRTVFFDMSEAVEDNFRRTTTEENG